MATIKHKNQRVAVFIDTQNLYHSAKNLWHGAKVNFKNILDKVVANRELVRALAYVITTPDATENNFFEALTKMGVETKTKDLQIFFGGNKKADWDVGLAVDAIKMANKVDVIILATGDGDFVPLVEYLKTFVQVEVISFGKSTATSLREAADDFVDMSEDPERYLINFSNDPNQKRIRSRAKGVFQRKKILGE